MPDTLKRLDVAQRTDTGRVREHNEDYVDHRIPDPNSEEGRFGSLFIVADGIGSLGKGDVASREATAAFIKEYYNPDVDDNDIYDRIRNGVDAANDTVLGWAQHFELDKMGTTLAGMVIMDSGEAYVFNVGDSRVYRLRGNTIKQMSQDTSVSGGGKNAPLTRYIGQPSAPEPVMVYVDAIEQGDTYLICSDGLDKTVSEDEMLKVTRTRRAKPAVNKLINMANDRGAPDNVTALVLRNGSPAFNPIPVLIGLGLLVLVGVIAVLLITSSQDAENAEATEVAMANQGTSEAQEATETQFALAAIEQETQVAVDASATANAGATADARGTEQVISETETAISEATDSARETERALVPTQVEATNAAQATLTAVVIAEITENAQSTADVGTAIANAGATADAEAAVAVRTLQAVATSTANGQITQTAQAQATLDAGSTSTQEALNVLATETAQAQATDNAQASATALQASILERETATAAFELTATAVIESTQSAQAEQTANAQATATVVAQQAATEEQATVVAQQTIDSQETATIVAQQTSTAIAAEAATSTAQVTPTATETEAATDTPDETETSTGTDPTATQTPIDIADSANLTFQSVTIPEGAETETYSLNDFVTYVVDNELIEDDESDVFAEKLALATDGGLEGSNQIRVLRPILEGVDVFRSIFMRNDSIIAVQLIDDEIFVITDSGEEYVYASCALLASDDPFDCFVPLEAIVRSEIASATLTVDTTTEFRVEANGGSTIIRFVNAGEQSSGANITLLGKATVAGETWYYINYTGPNINRDGWVIGDDVSVTNETTVPEIDPDNPNGG